jgi:hypothetical protein
VITAYNLAAPFSPVEIKIIALLELQALEANCVSFYTVCAINFYLSQWQIDVIEDRVVPFRGI